MTAIGVCYFCGDVVESWHSVAWPVVGWEAERGQGGANRIIGRKRPADAGVAHVHCVEAHFSKERRRIHPGQESFI